MHHYYFWYADIALQNYAIFIINLKHIIWNPINITNFSKNILDKVEVSIKEVVFIAVNFLVSYLKCKPRDKR